jgi:molybdopterin converting factor subunit 1
MILRVRLFARARDLGGAETLSVEVPAEATVGELRQRLATVCPALAALLPRCAVAVNSDLAEDERMVAASDEVAILPPVSGG